jgi:prepilin-type processing-associated H-X9-DG protein
VAIALHNFDSANKRLPAGNNCPELPGFNPGNYSAIYGCHNWFTAILPYVEQGTVFDAMDLHKRMPDEPNAGLILNRSFTQWKCPSDPDAALQGHGRFLGMGGGADDLIVAGPQDDSVSSMAMWYKACSGPAAHAMSPSGCAVPPLTGDPRLGPEGLNCTTVGLGRFDLGCDGLIPSGWVSYRFDDCTDGTSCTFIVGEDIPSYCKDAMMFHSHNHTGSTNPYPNEHLRHPECPKVVDVAADPSLIGAAAACFRYVIGFKSLHPGGLNMAMADGSARFFEDQIDYGVWALLGHKSDERQLGSY